MRNDYIELKNSRHYPTIKEFSFLNFDDIPFLFQTKNLDIKLTISDVTTPEIESKYQSNFASSVRREASLETWQFE